MLFTSITVACVCLTSTGFAQELDDEPRHIHETLESRETSTAQSQAEALVSRPESYIDPTLNLNVDEEAYDSGFRDPSEFNPFKGLLAGYTGTISTGFVGAGVGTLFLPFYGTLVGAGIGMIAGSPIGVYTYGQTAGFDGGFLLTTAGAIAGYGLGVKAYDIFDEGFENPMLMQAISLTMMQIGAVAGYALSLQFPSDPDGSKFDDSPAARSPSLLDLDIEHGLSFGVPAIGFQNNEDERRYSVQLLGGRF